MLYGCNDVYDGKQELKNLCEEEKKEQKQKNFNWGMLCYVLVGIGLIVCLQPVHNYLNKIQRR